MYSSTHSYPWQHMEVISQLTPRPLYRRGRSPRYPFDRGLAGPQRRSGRDGEDKNASSYRELKSGRPNRSPAITVTFICVQWLHNMNLRHRIYTLLTTHSTKFLKSTIIFWITKKKPLLTKKKKGFHTL
jgi:hypothetical protein